MAELLVVGFLNNVHRADGVLDELRVLDEDWIMELISTVAVHRDASESVTMDQGYQPTGRKRGEDEDLLGFLIAWSVGVRIIVGASATIAIGAKRAKSANADELMIEQSLAPLKNLFGKAAVMLVAGNSAIFALVKRPALVTVSARFQRYGGVLLHLPISDHQQRIIDGILNGIDSAI